MARLHVIVVSFDDGEKKRHIALRSLIDSFILQTCPDWIMTIVHDGPPTQRWLDVIKLYESDNRICWLATDVRAGFWGLVNKKMVLAMLPAEPGDFVLNTNDDNYYVPMFVELMMGEAAVKGTSLVHCDFLHHNFQYDTIVSRPETNLIDMGCFITEISLAKELSFPEMIPAHDGLFAEQAAAASAKRGLRVAHIPKVLFVHN